MEKTLFIIAGCNGAGKTTVSYTILPKMLDCKEFVNADEIAKGLSPFQPESVSIEAGKIMLSRIDTLIKDGKNFAFETTLSSKNYKSKIKEAQRNDYYVCLLFFWLRSEKLAIERVKSRVKEGGHNIEKEIIIRRYYRGIKNLFDVYIPIVDEAIIFDNSAGEPVLIFEKLFDDDIQVSDTETFNLLKSTYNEFK